MSSAAPAAPASHSHNSSPNEDARTMRRRLGLGRHRRAEVELHLWRCLRALLRGEVRLGLEAEQPGIEHGRKTLHRGVVSLYGFVETLALHCNAVLGAFELR